MAYCSNCGTELASQEAIVCLKCGAPTSRYISQKNNAGYTAGSIIGFFFLSLLIPLVAEVFGIIGLTKKKKNSGWVLGVGIFCDVLRLPLTLLLFAQTSALAPFIYAIF